MTLGERIGAQRRRCGLSQERVAEQVGVSRQAVTKWERGQSTPSTENLFKLARLFGTTVDVLLAREEDKTDTTEEAYRLLREKEARRAAEKARERREALRSAAEMALGYLALYLLGRVVWCDRAESSVLGWLFLNRPAGENSYLYGWLLSSHLFLCAAVVTELFALFGKKYVARATLLGFVVGLASGMVFGPRPEARPWEMDHYGWLIWGVCFLVSMLVGIVWEHGKKKKAAQ